MDEPDRKELDHLLSQWDAADRPAGGHSFPAAKLRRLIELERLASDDSQPTPNPVEGPAMHQLLIDELHERERIGVRRYGERLHANNGRDALRDLLDELLDAAAYTRQLMVERDGK